MFDANFIDLNVRRKMSVGRSGVEHSGQLPVEPFEASFMALFGRRYLPHRSSLSRFLADVDHPCLEAFRTLFEQQTFAEGWTAETIGGIFALSGAPLSGL
jgi:hypothetical protein